MNTCLSFFLRSCAKARLLIAIFLFFQNNYAMDNREDFHATLKEAHPDWFKEGVCAYYKHTDVINCQQESGIDQWTSVLTFEGKKIYPTTNGIYTYNEQVSFKLNDCAASNQEQGIAVSMMRNGISTLIECKKSGEEKKPALTNFNSYNDLVRDLQGKKIWWREKVTYQGYSSPNDPESSVVSIARVNAKKNQIILRGIEFTYRQDPAQTKIYCDFVDTWQKPIHYLRPLTYDHKQSNVNKKVYQVCNQVLYESNAKDITYDIFDSSKMRNDWISDNTDFYDQNNHKMTTLPDRYCNCAYYQGVPVEPKTWILEENLKGVYEFEGDRTLLDKNDYLCSSGDGQLFVTLPYKTLFKEYLSEQNNIPVHYLEQVTVPSLLVDKNVAIEGGHRIWPAGIYKKISSIDSIIWQPIAMKETQEIVQFHDQVLHRPAARAGKLSVKWPHTYEAYSAQQSKRWCDAAQRMFLIFGAKIRCCDKNLLQGFAAWNKLTSLDISNLTLEKEVTWNDIATSIGSMGQLTELRFCNNNPIVDFNEDYNNLADRVSKFYATLGLSLKALQHLKTLHIQGLWLSANRALDDYQIDEQERLRRFAILTGIVNHHDRKGISSIIYGISSLKHLETLSLDNIPAQGFSFADREKSISFATMLGFFLVPIDSYFQTEDLKTFAVRSADVIANIPSLQKICIYTPEKDSEELAQKYSNHLDTMFKERLSASRSPDLSALTVLSERY